MSGTAVRREGMKEIAREKARMLGKVSPEPYSPEEDRKRGSSEEQQEGKKLPPEEKPFFEQISPDEVDLGARRVDDTSFSWTQFSPWRKEGKKKKAPRFLNTVTIWCTARKMIDREWRKAKGTPKKDRGLAVLEQEAAQIAIVIKEREEAEKIRQQEAEARFRKHKQKFEEALKTIGERMVEEKETLTSTKALRLIEDTMGGIGKVYNVEWRDDGCDVWIEPWEERWPRQKAGETLPVIYKLEINDKMEMASYDLVKDERIIKKQQERMLANQLEKSVDEPLHEPLEEDKQPSNIEASLEKRIDQIGRLIELKKQKENIWIASVEPWEEMRKRNIENKGKGPIVTEGFSLEWANGTVEAFPIGRTDKPWEKKVEVKSGSSPQ